jgi:TRAP-type C4-dicarboxylate transport system permease small subunit
MRRIRGCFIKLLEWIVTGLFAVIIFTAFVQIFARYVLDTSIVWINDLDIQLMIWAVWLCAPIGLVQKAHMKVDFFEGSFSPTAQRILNVFFDFLTVAFLVILGVWGTKVMKSLAGMIHLTLPVPTSLLFAAAPIGACLMLFVIIPDVTDDLRNLLFERDKDGPAVVEQGGH